MKKIFASLICIVIALGMTTQANSASLSLAPLSGQYQVGQNFSVTFLVNTNSQVMNASSGVVTFPSNILEVVSISKTGSIFSLWVQEPSFSNASGTINFEGVVLNPGYSGNGGKLLTVTFRPKTQGTAQIKYTSGSVLANDGLGTNIASTLSTGTYTVTAVETPPQVELPRTPASQLSIRSSTHPDQDAWYNATTAIFEWDLPRGALETRILIGRNPNSTPTVIYNPPINTRTIEDLNEGTYYFSVQVRTAAGWSAVERYMINIDTTPPSGFDVNVEYDNQKPIVSFETDDIDSGFSHYEIKIGDGEIFRIDERVVNRYELPNTYTGTQSVVIQAFDLAGNSTSSDLKINFPAPDIIKPVITDSPEEVEQGTILTILGTALPNSSVRLSVARRGNVVFTEEGAVSEEGVFTFMVPAQFDLGYHTVVVHALDGQKTLQSNPVAVKVIPSPVLHFIITFVTYLGAALVVVIGLASLIKIILYLSNDLRRTISFFRHKHESDEKIVPVKKISSPVQGGRLK